MNHSIFTAGLLCAHQVLQWLHQAREGDVPHGALRGRQDHAVQLPVGQGRTGAYDGWLGVNGEGVPFESRFWFAEIGLVPQFPAFPPEMPVEAFLLASCRAVLRAPTGEIVRRLQDVMELCSLEEVRNRFDIVAPCPNTSIPPP